MPKVSIVLPTYNGEDFIRESLDSILAQTCEDWELIIVNDCSGDSTPEIIEGYAALDNRIRIIHNKVNQKLPESLNIGFREAKGEYLTWTSDDNRYLPSAIERMVQYLDINENEVMVCARMNVVNENGNFHSTFEYDDNFMMYNDCVGACFLYRRCVLESIGEYDAGFFLVEDYEYWMRIMLHYGHIGWINETLYLYRMHGGSLTGTRKKDIRKQLLNMRVKYLDKIIGRYRENLTYLTMVYVEFLLEWEDISGISERFFEIFPELRRLKKLRNEENIMAYGAGMFGDKAAEVLKGRLELYLDQRAEELGFIKNGRKVINLEQLKEYTDKNILITMSIDKIADALLTLSSRGVDKIFVCDLA